MRTVALIVLAGVLMGLASCPAYVDRIYEENLAEWREVNPGVEPTQELLDDLRRQAEVQAQKEQDELLKSGGSAVGGFATGNYIGGALGLIGLIGLGLGIRGRLKKKKGAV